MVNVGWTGEKGQKKGGRQEGEPWMAARWADSCRRGGEMGLIDSDSLGYCSNGNIIKISSCPTARLGKSFPVLGKLFPRKKF